MGKITIATQEKQTQKGHITYKITAVYLSWDELKKPNRPSEEVMLVMVNHLSEAHWSVEEKVGYGVRQGKVLDQELLENWFILQHAGQSEACTQNTCEHFHVSGLHSVKQEFWK